MSAINGYDFTRRKQGRMNSRAVKSLRGKLARGEATYGLWVTLESASVTEMAVGLSLDWVVIDAEHGSLDWRDVLAHIRAAVRSDTVALVRIAELNAGLIKRCLDIGADGVVVPWIETVDQLEHAVSCAHYPPRGIRGIGGERATCWGACLPDSVVEAEEHVLVVPLIESVKGGTNARALVKVDGVEMFFVGPADYSSTAGFPGEWEGGDVAAQLQDVLRIVRDAGKHCGVVVRDTADLAARKSQGYNLLGLGLDGSLLVRAIREMLQPTGRTPKLNPAFTLESDWSDDVPTKPLESVPPALKPDRRESINRPGAGLFIELARGVNFECLVGQHNHAKQLTTGLATFDPEATLPYHRHPFSESITLLSGTAMLDIEGRRYKLDVMDNAVLPPGLPHQAVNLSRDEPAVFHVAMASSDPTRELVDRFFSRRTMPQGAPPIEGAERINWFKTAPRFQAGPGATFIDWFNRDLIPGIEMSGGHGTFEPGGRLPCHIHDFDESICIIDGVATCIVEGRRYAMSDSDTALQPRGRCHYFINESDQKMVMIWVYAGPAPERIVLKEDLCLINTDVDDSVSSHNGNSYAIKAGYSR